MANPVPDPETVETILNIFMKIVYALGGGLVAGTLFVASTRSSIKATEKTLKDYEKRIEDLEDRSEKTALSIAALPTRNDIDRMRDQIQTHVDKSVDGLREIILRRH